MKAIFDEFRKQVLALDPCVTEEFLKLYVAYKAETNFVDVVPQAKRLRLSLNMAFQRSPTRKAYARMSPGAAAGVMATWRSVCHPRPTCLTSWALYASPSRSRWVPGPTIEADGAQRMRR